MTRPRPDDLAGWVDELAGVVRLGVEVDRAAELRRVVQRITGEQDGRLVERLLVRALLHVAGQALVDEQQAQYEAARRLLDQCDEQARADENAGEIACAFDEVVRVGAQLDATMTAYSRYFGPAT